MAQDPGRRYGSCAELISAARAALAAPARSPDPTSEPPARLRGPLPPESGAFASPGVGPAGWLIPLFGIAALSVMALVLFLAFGADTPDQPKPPSTYRIIPGTTIETPAPGGPPPTR